jgi:hypothetical protein
MAGLIQMVVAAILARFQVVPLWQRPLSPVSVWIDIESLKPR